MKFNINKLSDLEV